jgi:hypothetical protein
MWDTADGVRTFCEVKLSERDFGKAKNDTRHIDKLRDTYLPILAPHVNTDLCEAPVFFASYQILRNIWHLVKHPNARLVFLIPRANEQLWRLLDKTLVGVTPPICARVHRVAIEDVIDRLIRNELCPPELRDYAGELRQKYVLRSPTAGK